MLLTLLSTFRRRPVRDRLAFSDDGLTIRSPSGADRIHIAWRRVVELRAFKRDELATDLICLEMQAEGEGWYLLHEEMDGFYELAERLPDLLPGALRFHEWFSRVAFPAFAPNPTVIFSKSSPPLQP